MSAKKTVNGVKHTFGNLEENDDEYFSKRKGALMEMFEKNLQKTIETINGFKIKNLEEEEDPDLLPPFKVAENNLVSNPPKQKSVTVKISDIVAQGSSSKRNRVLNDKWNYESEEEEEEEDTDEEEFDLEKYKELAKQKFSTAIIEDDSGIEDEEEAHNSNESEEEIRNKAPIHHAHKQKKDKNSIEKNNLISFSKRTTAQGKMMNKTDFLMSNEEWKAGIEKKFLKPKLDQDQDDLKNFKENMKREINKNKLNPQNKKKQDTLNETLLIEKEREINLLLNENKELKLWGEQLEHKNREEKNMMREQHKTILQTNKERQQKSLEITKNQYESEISYLREELSSVKQKLVESENKLISNHTVVTMKDDKSVTANFSLKREKSQTSQNSLERNFLKLKELYDTLYKANTTLMGDQREMEVKYSKLLKVYNKQCQKNKKMSRTLQQSNSNTRKRTLSRSKRTNSRSKYRELDPYIIDSSLGSYLSYGKEKLFTPNKQTKKQNHIAINDDSLFSNSMIQKSVLMNKRKKKSNVYSTRSRSRKRKHFMREVSFEHSLHNSSVKKKKETGKRTKKMPKARTCMLTNNPNYF